VSTLRARMRDEAGFTLVELLMAIVIMGVVLGPLAAGLLVGLRTSDETANRLAGSNDAQLLSIWLPPDVQSTGGGASDVSTSNNTDCSGVTNVLRLRWTETTGSSSATYIAAYAVSQNGTGEWRLVRYACVNGGTPSTHVVARNLAGSSAATVSVNGTKIAMTVTEAHTAVNPTGYVFTVSGHRRTL
jgi:prepilin-type N-terminal cleavage/methylation domain-containing protein